jgi:hypothetical protein
MPASRGIAPLADIPDGDCRDSFPQPMIRCKHSVIPMPVPPRRRTFSVSLIRSAWLIVTVTGLDFLYQAI